MADTLPGTPYVESSDLVANYPAVSEDLAERVDLVGILPFADSTARGTALPTPTDGQYSYLQDTNSTEFWNGSAWVPADKGKVLQVISTTKTDTFSTSSSTMVDVTGLTATITPTLATSKVFIIVSGAMGHSGTNERTDMNLRRDSTNIGTAVGGTSAATATFLDTTEYAESYTITFLDTPASTSAITYGIQISTPSGTAQIGRLGISDRRGINTITVIEVAA